MFDKLIESDTPGADFKNRSRYFTVSTIIVGILFLTAVVYSLYAADIGLGSLNFEVSELLAPLEPTEPVALQPEQNDRQRYAGSTLHVRTSNIARTDEFQFVPDKPSSQASNIPSRPIGKYILDPNGINSNGIGGQTGLQNRIPGGGGTTSATDHPDIEEITTGAPPPAATRPLKPPTQSLGVINGKATYLPVPAYPQPARLVGAFGEVKVQVAIDEDGRVISAKAVSGHALLRPAAESSARNAKFSPTYLSKVPVKVTGVIMYNFIKP